MKQLKTHFSKNGLEYTLQKPDLLTTFGREDYN